MAYKDKKTGKWIAQWYTEDVYGKKVLKKKRGFRTLREAKAFEDNQHLIQQKSLNIDLKSFFGIYYEENPKPDQLEKIASALGFNVSIFLDLNIETAGDILSLLFLIDESTGLSLSEETLPNGKKTIRFDFENPTLQDFIEKWCEFKNIYEKERMEILSIEDEDKRQKELEKIDDTYAEWKMRAMATTIGCHTIVKKGIDKEDLSITDLT